MIVFLQLHAYESMKESLFKSAADNAKLNSGHMVSFLTFTLLNYLIFYVCK